MVILWLLGCFGECRVWLSSHSKVVRWEQQNEKAGFVLHKGCSHQDSAGQVESGSLGLINHDLHSFIQHIQTQTYISLPASSADSTFLLPFNMWPYTGILVSVFRWRKSEEQWEGTFRFVWANSPREIFTFIKKKRTNCRFKVQCFAKWHKLLVYIFPFFQVNTRHPFGLMEFIVVTDRFWIGQRKWGGKRGIRTS